MKHAYAPVVTRWILTLVALGSSGAAAQDTIVVRGDGPPRWGQNVQAVEELRIGTLDGAEEEMFGRIGSMAVTSDGTIWVEDSQVPIIRRFSPDGTFLGNVGREGEGPGEYLRMQGMKPMPDGGVAIWDPRNTRISVYEGDGAFVTSHRVPAALFAAEVFQVDTAGFFYVRTLTHRPVTPDQDPDYGWIRISPDGEVVDTLPVPPRDQLGGGFVLATNQGYMRPFPIETMSTVSPHGYLVTARNSDYAFTRPLPDGRILKVSRDYEPLSVTRPERDQWLAFVRMFEEAARDQGRTPAYGPIPDRKPPFQWIWADEEGRVWVSRYAEAEHHPLTDEERAARGDRPALEWRQAPVFDVFEADGTFLGQVRLPPNTRIAASRGDRLWAVTTGEFGEAYVVRFRIR